MIPVSAGFSLGFSATGKSLPMSLLLKKSIVQNDYSSALFFQKICRFSVPDRKKIHWSRLEVTVWNTFHCCFIRFTGILKRATMNRKHSGLFVAIWCEAAKELKCWSIWSALVIVPWKFCLSERTFFWVPHKKRTRVSFWTQISIPPLQKMQSTKRWVREMLSCVQIILWVQFDYPQLQQYSFRNIHHL